MPAYKWIDHSSDPTKVQSSSLGVYRKKIIVWNVRILNGILSPISPQQHTLHFNPFHFVFSYSHSFISGRPGSSRDKAFGYDVDSSGSIPGVGGVEIFFTPLCRRVLGGPRILL